MSDAMLGTQNIQSFVIIIAFQNRSLFDNNMAISNFRLAYLIMLVYCSVKEMSTHLYVPFHLPPTPHPPAPNVHILIPET